MGCVWQYQCYPCEMEFNRNRLNFKVLYYLLDRLCGLVVRVPCYKSRGPGFDPRRYQIFWEVVGLERGPLSLVSAIEELCSPRDTLYLQNLALTSTSGGRSVGIVRSRTKTTEFVCFIYLIAKCCCRWQHSPHNRPNMEQGNSVFPNFHL
jgi:hypothetical protein